jgi:acetylglutamate kinase
VPGAYLSKFAVEPDAQGEGIGNDLWQAILRDFPQLFWRTRPDNPINPWYQSVCDGMLRLQSWNVYWRGIAAEKIPDLVERAQMLPGDFEPSSLEQPTAAASLGSAMVLHDRR